MRTLLDLTVLNCSRCDDSNPMEKTWCHCSIQYVSKPVFNWHLCEFLLGFKCRETVCISPRLTSPCCFFSDSSWYTWLSFFLDLLVFSADVLPKKQLFQILCGPVLRNINVFNLAEHAALPQPECAETEYNCHRGQHRETARIFPCRRKDKVGMNLQSIQGRMYYFKTLHVCPGRQTIAFLKAYHFCFTVPSEMLDTSQCNLKISSSLMCLQSISLTPEQLIVHLVWSGKSQTF